LLLVTESIIPTAVGGTIAHARHAGLFDGLMARIAGCFGRREPRQVAGELVSGLLMELEDKNCWTLAEALGHSGPHRLQHLLSRAVWDEQQVLAETAAWAVEHLDDGDAVLIVDETGDAKSSTDCVGAARQYSGSLGGVALCQVTVNLTFATGKGHAIIDRRLYMPQGWTFDEERRELAGVPDELEFITKPLQAAQMLRSAHQRGVRAAFLVGDEVYGGRELRGTAREQGMSYVMAVKHDHTVTLAGQAMTARRAIRLIPDAGWQRLRTGTGSKGIRSYDWAQVEIEADDTPDGHPGGHSVLLVRRHRYTRKLSFYRCWTPAPVPLSRLVAIATIRWKIEEDHQLAKQTTGLDAGQTTRWTSWHRWSCLALLAYAFLTVGAALQRTEQPDDPDLTPITVPELLRLLRLGVVPQPDRDPHHRHTWSLWRRRHQHRATRSHQAWHHYAETTP
jgi:SRSO17 transposase